VSLAGTRDTRPRASRTFARGVFCDTTSMLVLRRLLVPLLVIHVVLALWSGYRAIVQVFRLELQVTQPLVRAGSAVGYAVVSSGRVPVTVRLELIQGARAETLATTRVRDDAIAGYDPRLQRARQSAVLTEAVLSKFEAGPALMRVTAVGSPQWLRTPPPTVRDLAVRIER